MAKKNHKTAPMLVNVAFPDGRTIYPAWSCATGFAKCGRDQFHFNFEKQEPATKYSK
jgi:hypothetical protein